MLEKTLPNHALVSTIKECLHNGPECRPSAKHLLTVLEKMKEIAEGCHEAIAKTRAMRQVLAAKDFADLEQQLKVKKLDYWELLLGVVAARVPLRGPEGLL